MNNPDTLDRFKNTVSENLNAVDLETDNSSLNEKLLKTINEAASENIPVIANPRFHQPWHNDDKLRELYELKDRLMLHNSDQSLIKATRKKIRLRCKYLKNRYLEQEAEQINQLVINRNLERLFHRAKRQDTTLKPVPSSCQPQKLLEHFKSHFNPVDPSDLIEPAELRNDLPTFINDLHEISRKTPINDNPPSIDEIRKHIKLLKNKKANNDIDAELLKLCDDPTAHRILQQIAKNAWNNLDIPLTWGNSRLKTLWKKKGSKNDPSKYRGLSIGSTICKLLINIILERLRPWYDAQLTDKQNGFRQNRGTTDGIFVLKRVQQITDRKKQPLYLLFVDLTAAYDHIPRSWLFQSLKIRFPDQCPTVIKVLEKLYEQTSLTFPEADETFSTTFGVRQGGPESPLLFNLYVDYVMRIFVSKCKDENIQFYEHSYRINPRSISRDERLEMRRKNIASYGTKVIPWNGYADDLILFLLTTTDLQKSTDLLDEIFTAFGLKINVQKTESMILNPQTVEYPKTIVTLRNTAIKNIENFVYLGAYIRFDQPNTGDPEINHRIQLAVSKFADLSNLLQNQRIHLKTRINFLNSFVRSTLTYASQNWNANANQIERLYVVYRGFLRRMVRGGYRDVNETENDYRFLISNEQLHNLCGTSDLSTFIRKQQFDYAKHVIRMPQCRSVKLLAFNSDKYTKRGRPCKTLFDIVTNENGLSLDELCNRGLERK